MAYAPRVIDGISYGLNWGLVGFGSNDSKGLFDNITVQVLPPQITYTNTEDFSDGVADLLTAGSAGTWAVSGGRINGNPVTSGAAAYDLVALPGVTNLQTSSYLDVNAVVNTATRAGIVFDWYSATDYKWAAIDTAGTVSVGHFTTRSGRVTDKSFATTIRPATDYTLDVSLKGSTVSVSLNGQAVLGYVFNSVTVDGRFGLLAYGATSFDNAAVKTNDSAFATTKSAELDRLERRGDHRRSNRADLVGLGPDRRGCEGAVGGEWIARRVATRAARRDERLGRRPVRRGGRAHDRR